MSAQPDFSAQKPDAWGVMLALRGEDEPPRILQEALQSVVDRAGNDIAEYSAIFGQRLEVALPAIPRSIKI